MAGEDLEVAVEEIVIGLLDPTDPEFEIEIVEISVKRRPIVVLVYAPKELEPKRFRFPLGETVGVAAKVAAEAFGYQAGIHPFRRRTVSCSTGASPSRRHTPTTASTSSSSMPAGACERPTRNRCPGERRG